MENRLFKATLKRGTLHLVSARDFDHYRVASRYPLHVWSEGLKQLQALGVDVDVLREDMLAALDAKPLKIAGVASGVQASHPCRASRLGGAQRRGRGRRDDERA